MLPGEGFSVAAAVPDIMATLFVFVIGVAALGISAADALIAMQIVLEMRTAGTFELARGDVFPPGAPDGAITLQDLMPIMQLL